MKMRYRAVYHGESGNEEYPAYDSSGPGSVWSKLKVDKGLTMWTTPELKAAGWSVKLLTPDIEPKDIEAVADVILPKPLGFVGKLLGKIFG